MVLTDHLNDLQFAFLLLSLALVEILPSGGVQYICHGGQLNLTCATNETILKWTVTIPQITNNYTRRVTTYDTFGNIQTIYTSTRIIFRVWRSPDDLYNDNLPLVSMLASENVSIGLNGTTVTCSGMATRIHIIGNSLGIPLLL